MSNIPPKAIRRLAPAVKSGGQRGVLPLGDIKTAEELFQYRYGIDPSHVTDLAGELTRHPDGLEPVLVWESNAGIILLDGHHRMLAYQKAAWSKPIPVQYSSAETVAEARRLALTANSRNKKAYSKSEKSNGAWGMVCARNEDGTTVFSKTVTANSAGVSETQVAVMRRTYEKLRADNEDPARFTDWTAAAGAAAAKSGASEDIDIYDNARHTAAVERDANKLGKAFGPSIHKNPTSFGEATVKVLGHSATVAVAAMLRAMERSDLAADLEFPSDAP